MELTAIRLRDESTFSPFVVCCAEKAVEFALEELRLLRRQLQVG